jgi:uridine kinase
VDFDLQYLALAAPVVSLIRRAMDEKKAPVMVGVCGRSRAGKSVAVHAVMRALTEDDTRCLRVRLDDWIMPKAERQGNYSAETRNRVDVLPGVIASLRAGKSVCAPGYDPASRGPGDPVTYDPTGQAVIVIEGGFAGHYRLRSLLDLIVFVDAPEALQHARFHAFYRWKGLDQKTIELLWRDRAADEWPAIDAQRKGADFVLTLGDIHS